MGGGDFGLPSRTVSVQSLVINPSHMRFSDVSEYCLRHHGATSTTHLLALPLMLYVPRTTFPARVANRSSSHTLFLTVAKNVGDHREVVFRCQDSFRPLRARRACTRVRESSSWNSNTHGREKT